MIFNDVKTKGIKKEFGETEKIMKNLGFDRSWDYNKATYDLKYTDNNKVDYYLRLRGTVVNDKQLEHPKALLEFGVPVFARHFFPHGLDESVEVPKSLKEKVEAKLVELEKALAS
ncbi:YugN family protein [Hazenella coriacea]|uniref:YugN-like protein n=1 Tax=Hazenella coriacea TaxID=1179467 RepID=A0A4R3L5F6_9BACL|nr:YugN family protein [Hazenella coriacea]TCS95031.1 YugN-like protein [Hazenella coriacea]